MKHVKGQTGSLPSGSKARDKVIRVAGDDKPLIETYRALLDNPDTRDAAIDALNMVKQLQHQ